MNFDRAVGSSTQNFSLHLKEAKITDPVPFPKNQKNSVRVLMRKLVACSHFRDVHPGERATQLHFPSSFICIAFIKKLILETKCFIGIVIFALNRQ